jgi:hypothetical protein
MLAVSRLRLRPPNDQVYSQPLSSQILREPIHVSHTSSPMPSNNMPNALQSLRVHVPIAAGMFFYAFRVRLKQRRSVHACGLADADGETAADAHA